jgi:hypothetical protein
MSLIHEIDFGTPRPKSEKTVTLTIDGVAVTVPEGTSIMRAAVELGREIPKLCATDMVEAFGSCRLCLVEIQGRAGTPASCTTPVAEGMVVHTQTERLKRLRKGVMELYISEHPLDCLTCSANGDCSCRTWPAPSACARCATVTTARSTSIRASTLPILISPTSLRNASSVRAACGLARRCKALSR